MKAQNIANTKYIRLDFGFGQNRSTKGCSKLKSQKTRQVQERLVSTLEHMQVPKWDRTNYKESVQVTTHRLVKGMITIESINTQQLFTTTSLCTKNFLNVYNGVKF